MGSDEWINLLSGTVGVDGAGPLVRAAAGQLQDRIDADPHIEERIDAILDRRLAGPANGLTLATVQSALSTYLGDDISFLLVWLSEPNTTIERVADFDAIAPTGAANLVRTLLARYWQELRDAHEYAGQSPDEWRSLTQEAFLDQLTAKYTVRVRIEKYSGEAIVLEASPNSALALIKFLTRALATISTPGIFDPANLDEFLGEVDDFRSRLAAETDADVLRDAAEPLTGEPSDVTRAANLVEPVN